MAGSRIGRVLSMLAPGLLAVALPAQAAPSLVPLNFRVVDAEYSDALERIVMVSAAPNRLHVFDPLTALDVPVNLPLAPTSVSVAPNGLFAAVGHDGWVSYVDLAGASLVKTIPVSTVAVDVVLAGNGFVYVFPAQDQWEYIRCIQIATETETLSTGRQLYAGTRARLHPGGGAIYGANRGLSPSDIEKYSITAGTASYLYDSPYHGEYAMCGDLWISEDGLRIFTACGNVFRSSELPAGDMIYGGSLSAATHVLYATHSSEAGKILVVSDTTPTSDTVVQIYDQAFLAFEGTLSLPDFVLPTGRYDAHGRFVFFSGSGAQRFAIVQADATSGLLYDYAVVRLGPPPATDFHTVTPCRIFDTRETSGPTAGAPITCGTGRSFAVAGSCAVPSSAKAVSLNVTGTGSTAQGNIRLFAAGDPAPLASTLNYVAGQTRANNAVVPLGTDGEVSILCSPSGTTHVVLDVNGYFEQP